MKANEVLNLLRITRPTLTKYVKEGIIKTEKLQIVVRKAHSFRCGMDST